MKEFFVEVKGSLSQSRGFPWGLYWAESNSEGNI